MNAERQLNVVMIYMPIPFAAQLFLRAESFPPLTLGLLILQDGGPSEPRRWQPELSAYGGCQPWLFNLGRVVFLKRQRLATYAASGISQSSSYIWAE